MISGRRSAKNERNAVPRKRLPVTAVAVLRQICKWQRSLHVLRAFFMGDAFQTNSVIKTAASTQSSFRGLIF